MMRYYERHYTPDRATVIVVGGVDRAEVIAAVGEAFAAIPRGSVERREFSEPPPLGETRLTLRQNTQVPRLLLAFRSRPLRDPKEPWLDVLSQVLAGDKTTRLEKRLVDGGIAASVACWSDARRDAGVFQVQVEPTEGHTLEECEAAVHEVLAALAKEGPTDAEIAQARAKLLAARVFGAESSLGLANRLGEVAVAADWRYHLRYPKAIEAATREGLRELAASVFDPRLAVVGRSLPREEDAPAGGGGDAQAPGGGGRRRAAGDAPARGVARRSDREGAGAGAAIERALVLDPVREVLPNGLTVLVLRRTAAPVFYAQLAVRDGRRGEAVPGLDALAGSLLEEGTTRRSAEEVAAAIGAVGGTLSAGGAGVSAKTLSKDAALALELVHEVASSPAFAPDALERARARQLQAIEEEADTPARVAALKLAEVVYGAGHPLGRSANGTPDSVRGLTREQVVAHHARFFVPKNATLVVVSDRAPADVLPLVRAAFGGWSGGDAPVLRLPAIPAPRASVTRLVTDKVQANTFLGHVGIVRGDPDYVALEVMDNVLGTGAGFTDRLSRNIRDEKGLAYTVYGNVTRSAGIDPGLFRVYAGTKPQHAALALAEMRKEVRGILERPPTPEELAGAKAALRGGLVSGLETAADVARMLDLCERHGLGFDYPRRYLAEVERITAEDVVRVAKAHLHPDALALVVVGPAEPADGAAK
jgi:zinc protease